MPLSNSNSALPLRSPSLEPKTEDVRIEQNDTRGTTHGVTGARTNGPVNETWWPSDVAVTEDTLRQWWGAALDTTFPAIRSAYRQAEPRLTDGKLVLVFSESSYHEAAETLKPWFCQHVSEWFASDYVDLRLIAVGPNLRRSA